VYSKGRNKDSKCLKAIEKYPTAYKSPTKKSTPSLWLKKVIGAIKSKQDSVYLKWLEEHNINLAPYLLIAIVITACLTSIFYLEEP
jgi:hypothetical protein